MGIEIRIHVTFLFLVTLIAMVGSEPGGPGLANSLLWLVVLFVCVLFHELCHSVVARSRGVGVRCIILLPIGGVSEMDTVPKGWRSELVISAAGPAANLFLALLGVAAVDLSGGQLLPAHLFGGSLLPRFVWANVVLGLFNLIPGFPLDGGRVLRAFLERRHDEVEATELVVLVGRVIAALIVTIGLFVDIWLSAIGAFMFFAGAPEMALVRARARLRGTRVVAVMRAPVRCLDGKKPFPAPGEWMRYPQIVTIDKRYAGVLDHMPAHPVSTVGDAADMDAPALLSTEDLGETGLDTLLRSGHEVLAVVDEQRHVVGVLTLADVVAHLDGRSAAPR